MSCITHTYINENGYKVCIGCGKAENEIYWNEEDMSSDLFKRATTPYHNTKHINLNDKWFKLIKTNSIYITNHTSYVKNEVIYILNQFPLGNKLRTELYGYMINKNFKSYREVWEAFYRIICSRDLPITTQEFINILNSDRKRKKSLKIFKPTHSHESVRKYYWYITKCIEKARKIIGFSYKEGQDLYKVVFNYYILIRFKMFKSTNPVYLIENLVYYAIRDKLKVNQQVFNKKNFGISTFSYITKLVMYLREIKEKNLDAPISVKLTINARNKLYSKYN